MDLSGENLALGLALLVGVLLVRGVSGVQYNCQPAVLVTDHLDLHADSFDRCHTVA